MAPVLLDDGLGVWPCAVAVGIVDLDTDVLHADRVAGGHGGDVLNGAEAEVAAQHVSRARATHALVAVAAAIADAVEALEQHGHPPDAALRHGDLQVGVLDGVARPEPFGGRGQGELPEEGGGELHSPRADIVRRLVIA